MEDTGFHSGQAASVPTAPAVLALLELEEKGFGGPDVDRLLAPMFSTRRVIHGPAVGQWSYENEPGWYERIPAFTTSLDDAYAFAERVLKTYYLTIGLDGVAASADVEWWSQGLANADKFTFNAEGCGLTGAAAACSAILRALAAGGDDRLAGYEPKANAPSLSGAS